MPKHGSIAFIACALLLIALANGSAACNSSKNSTPQPTVTPTAIAAADTPEPSATPEVSLPYDSFHYTVELQLAFENVPGAEGPWINGTVEGDYLAPDSHAFDTEYSVFGTGGSEGVVIIGDRAWYYEGDGGWITTSRTNPDVAEKLALSSADPDFLFAEDFNKDLGSLNGEAETVNGVATRKYHIPRELVSALRGLFGDGAFGDFSGINDLDMTVWLAEESRNLVKAEITASAGPEILTGDDPSLDLPPDAGVRITMNINLTHLNDAGITIEPPV